MQSVIPTLALAAIVAGSLLFVKAWLRSRNDLRPLEPPSPAAVATALGALTLVVLVSSFALLVLTNPGEALPAVVRFMDVLLGAAVGYFFSRRRAA